MAGRTVPVPINEFPGDYWTAAKQNAQVRDLNNFTLAPPVFNAYAAATQSIPTGNVMTALSLDTELLDSDSGHSTVTNTSRYTATVPGVYFVIATVGWGASATGDRRIQIALNGAAIIGSGTGADANQVVTTGQVACTFVTLNGTTDYIEVMAAQNSGGTLSTVGGGVFAPSMRVLWISR